uniref:Putative secreted protein n=1 Tax=Panstrongylus lignarius TaxID=156445 RepID=A0A224Y3I1_9HEMI
MLTLLIFWTVNVPVISIPSCVKDIASCGDIRTLVEDSLSSALKESQSPGCDSTAGDPSAKCTFFLFSSVLEYSPLDSE